MRAIAKFYTLFWVIYFPVCIAFYATIHFDWSDEILTVLLLLYAFVRNRYLLKSRRRTMEIMTYLAIMAFYVVYSLAIHVTTARGVWLDILQQLRPYAVFYITWMLNPQFTPKQQKLIKWVMLLSFAAYTAAYFLKPSLVNPYVGDAAGLAFKEDASIGQLALCSGMIFYLFSKQRPKDRRIAVLIILLGLISGKSKYFGECVCFIALVFFVHKKIKFDNLETYVKVAALGAVVIFFTWTKFNAYYVEGMQQSAERMARPMSYKVARRIIFHDYIPFGSGLGSFGTAAAAKEYSPIYYKYHMDDIWGLDPENPMFLADAFYPTLAEFGMFGLFFFLWFWARRLKEANAIPDIVHYRMALMAILALALESTADTSYLSGRGMGYFMILAICLNSGLKRRRGKLVWTDAAKKETMPSKR